MNILIVDDDDALLHALHAIVTDWGGDVSCVNSAPLALQAVTEAPYDFVLLDLRMPKYDGLWFMRNARIPPTTRVILMSGFAPRSVVQAILDLGACDYIEKPFSPDQLLETLERHVRRDPLSDFACDHSASSCS